MGPTVATLCRSAGLSSRTLALAPGCSGALFALVL